MSSAGTVASDLVKSMRALREDIEKDITAGNHQPAASQSVEMQKSGSGRQKISKMSAEVVDSNPYRYVLRVFEGVPKFRMRGEPVA